MRINCLSLQEELFETRMLRRVSKPIFLAAEDLPHGLDAPLVLYGNWHLKGFGNGLHWLSQLVFSLPFPCILLPPFEIGSIGNTLGLATALSVQTANTNQLAILPEATSLHLGMKSDLHVQTDYVFTGPTGKPWLAAGDTGLGAMTLVQPKNTSTPLLLCGTRLLSASGLSDTEDRLALLDGILTWATNWCKSSELVPDAPAYLHQLDDAKWQVVCILAAGAQTSLVNETIAMARSLFGVAATPIDIQLAHDRMVDYGLALRIGEKIKINPDALDTYTQEHGLWAYVRALRKDFERMQS